jgi:hypothetical protein
MAYCVSLHTADCRIGLYDLPVKKIHRSQPLIYTVALSVKLVGLIGGISCSQSLRAGAPDSLPNIIDPSALRHD